jgi:hypothetical protein
VSGDQFGVGWAFFLENKATSVSEIWKEPSLIDAFKSETLSNHIDLKKLELDVS